MGGSLPNQWFIDANALWERGRLSEAFRLFLAAARAGDPGAQVNVGYFYDTGQGVKKSRTRALYWYRRAARRGEASAATNIGTIYRDERRPRLALRWFEKAVALGDDDALLELARLHAGPLNDITKARKLLRKVQTSKNVTVDSQEQAFQFLKELRSSRGGRRSPRP